MQNNLNEPYFNKFDLERCCIDKVFFVVYDKHYSATTHKFDKNMRDNFIQHIKRSRIKKGGFQEVIRKENDYSSWELQLGGSRTMYFHVNIIHLLQSIHDIKPQHVIYDDNFMPVDDKQLTVIDYVKALREFISDAKQLYHDIVRKHWDIELGDIEVKIAQIELPFEVYPASVDDIANNLYASGVSFRKYNTQSQTLYLTENQWDNKVTFSDRKYDKEFPIDDDDLQVPFERSKLDNALDEAKIQRYNKSGIVYLNKINSGRTENKVQIKIYQKTFGLVRCELTIYSEDAKSIFKFDKDDYANAQRMVNFMHYTMKQNNITIERYDRSLDDVVRFLSKSFKEPEDLIYNLKNCDVFETCKANRYVQQRLTRKGLLLPKYDSDGKRQRGIYIVNPVVREFLNIYKPNGTEHFIKSGFCPDL